MSNNSQLVENQYPADDKTDGSCISLWRLRSLCVHELVISTLWLEGLGVFYISMYN